MKPRLVLGLTVAGVGAALAYCVQRAIDSIGEPAMGAVIAQVHIPYYSRMALSALIGGALGAAVGLGVSRVRALSLLKPWWILAAAAVCALSMLALP